MTENLEEMFFRAQKAEQPPKQPEQEKPLVKPLSEDDLKALLKDRESAIGETIKTKRKMDRAAELLEKSKEMTDGKEDVTAETEEFMRAATNSIQEQEARLVALEQQIKTASAEPAVVDKLHEQAKEEDRRLGLQKEISRSFWIEAKADPLGGSICRVLSKNYEYEKNVSGTHSGDDALCQLLNSARHASKVAEDGEVAVPFEEAEDIVRKLSEIRQEAEKERPDVKKIDDILSAFIFEGLKRFAATFDERVKRSAQSYYEYYQKNPDKTQNPTINNMNNRTAHQWEGELREDLWRVRRDLDLAKLAMYEKGFKAKTLAKFAENIDKQTCFIFVK